MSLSQLIAQAKELMNWVYEHTNRSIPSSGGTRELLGLALLQHSLDIATATVVLLEHRLPGPAWTLARPLLEGFSRSIWILHCATDEQIEKVRVGKWPSPLELLEAMDKNSNSCLNSKWIRSNKENVPVFHDFTHGGIEHALRRINTNTVKSAYPDKELEYLVRLAVEVNIRAGHELLVRVDDGHALRELFQLASCYRNIRLE